MSDNFSIWVSGIFWVNQKFIFDQFFREEVAKLWKFRENPLLLVQTWLLKHTLNINIIDDFDYISVIMIDLVDGALVKDNLILKQFYEINTFCKVKLLKD